MWLLTENLSQADIKKQGRSIKPALKPTDYSLKSFATFILHQSIQFGNRPCLVSSFYSALWSNSLLPFKQLSLSSFFTDLTRIVLL